MGVRWRWATGRSLPNWVSRWGSWLQQAEALRRDGQTVMFVAVDGQPAGLLGVADPIKSSTPEAMQLPACGRRADRHAHGR